MYGERTAIMATERGMQMTLNAPMTAEQALALKYPAYKALAQGQDFTDSTPKAA